MPSVSLLISWATDWNTKNKKTQIIITFSWDNNLNVNTLMNFYDAIKIKYSLIFDTSETEHSLSRNALTGPKCEEEPVYLKLARGL
jgi:formate-dependent nitrite reductase cytochrome c552 subunit